MTDAMSSSPGQTGIRVHTKFFPLAWIFFLLKTQICLDGGPPVATKWGESFIPASPGSHSVRCYVNYIIPRRVGDSSMNVEVPAGGTVTVQWKAPWITFFKGKWKQLGTPQAAAPVS